MFEKLLESFLVYKYDFASNLIHGGYLSGSSEVIYISLFLVQDYLYMFAYFLFVKVKIVLFNHTYLFGLLLIAKVYGGVYTWDKHQEILPTNFMVN